MDGSAKMHLKEWLVAQVESEQYEGLCWVDEAKTMFRIPWKHAAKKDYKQREDAALFKAWAVYKGKYREGRDKADPTMWKTRLRCALNKSTDFQEVPERNQLDITEPYKVYRVLHEAEVATSADTKAPVIIPARKSPGSPVVLDKDSEDLVQVCEENDKTLGDELMREHMYCDLTEKSPQNQSSAPSTFITPLQTISDFRMQVKLLYCGQCVMSVTTKSSDGCFILQGHVPMGNERIYGTCTAQQLSFPDPSSIPLPPDVVVTMSHLLCHLERGVLLWAAPDGVYIKRFCQGRVYWRGPTAPHADRPNKLEREKTFKLLDIPAFLKDLQSCLQGKGPVPLCMIELCFGEEYPDPNIPKSKKLIMVQVVPMFAGELLRRFNLRETEEKRPTLTANTDT